MMSTAEKKSSFYPAKDEFENYIASLPSKEDKLSFSQKTDLSLKAWYLFDKGLPHCDRPIALYYFYHFLPLSEDSEQEELSPPLVEAVSYSLAEKSIVDFVRLLDKERLYEVCQIRGDLRAYALRLIDFVMKNDLLAEWDSIRKASEEYLDLEPALPIPFLEAYMDAYDHYCGKTKKPEARLYEIAKQVVDVSTDRRVIGDACFIVDDEENIRAYQKKSLPPEDAKKLLALEELEEHVLSEFGGREMVRGAAAKAIGFLTKEGRERRAMQKEKQRKWTRRIRTTGRSSSPYVHGYAEALCSQVYIGTDDIRKAIKSLEKAYNYGFDPGFVSLLLSDIHDALKHKTEAAEYAQKALDFLGFESMEGAEKSEIASKFVLAIKAAGQQPQFAPRIWQSISSKNSEKRKELIDALEPKIESAKKEDVEKRTKMAIEIFDSIVDIAKTDEILSKGEKAYDTLIDTRCAELLVLSPEEIEIFTKSGEDKLLAFYNSQIRLRAAFEYLESLLNHTFGDLSENLEEAINSFPNLMASVRTAKKLVDLFIEGNKQDCALKLAEYAVESRSSTKAPGFYDAIGPLKDSINEKQQWLDEIDLISRSRKILEEGEFSTATSDLTEAYLAALDAEKSLGKKDELLKRAESESLSDDRLRTIRAEVSSLLGRRKKILTWIGVAVGAVIIVAILIAVLLK